MANVLAIYLQGGNEVSYENWAFSLHKPKYQLPKHLGYPGNKTFRRAVGSDVYAITKTRDYYWWQGSSQDRLDSIQYYNRGDTRRLRSDQSTMRVYSNGNFTLWET